MTEASVAWAEETMDGLAHTLKGLSLAPEHVELGSRGRALAVRTGGEYFVTVFAPASEGPSTVILSTGVFLGVDGAQLSEALLAINAYNRTRAGGRCALSSSTDGSLLVTLHETMMPAILTNVPPFFQALLIGFNPLSARKVLRGQGIRGERWMWNSTHDLIPILEAVDDEADVLLGADELTDPDR